MEVLKRKFVEIANKYQTIDTFDYFAEREAAEEDQQKRDSRYVWKSKDEIGDLKLITERGFQDLKDRVKKARSS